MSKTTSIGRFNPGQLEPLNEADFFKDFTPEQHARRDQLRAEQAKNREDGERERQQEAEARGLVLRRAKEIISAGKKAMAVKLHPDKGGTDKDMQELIEAEQYLLELMDKEVFG